MKPNCIGPYTITCTQLSGQSGGVLIDNSKTKQTVLIVSNSTNFTVPDNYIVLYQSDCNDKTIYWCEITGSSGRVYTIIPGLCSVSISSFENGLLDTEECNTTIFGSQNYSYGTPSACSASFEFDEMSFLVEATPSDYHLLDCGEDEQVSLFNFPGDSVESFNEYPVEIPIIETPETIPDETTQPETDNHAWSLPTDWETNRDFTCSPEVVLQKNNCESHNNPCITILQDGKSIITFEQRDTLGRTKISLMLIEMPIDTEVFYYRPMSNGTILNRPVTTTGITEFEIFDDIVIDTNSSNVPLETLYIGFLTGPLAGISLFRITSFTRDSQSIRPRYTIKFNSGGRIVEFPSSNNIADVKWFIIKSDTLLPLNLELLDLPVHTYNNVQVQVANPCVCTTKNHLMIGQDIPVYVTYQAYEQNKWNVYLRQLFISYNTQEDPIYTAPFQFDHPSYEQVPFVEDEYIDNQAVSADYHPENLYTLTYGDNTITRVVYNMSVKQPSDTFIAEKQIDINFVIDYSLGNFSSYLSDLKLHLPILDQLLRKEGVSPRYGLTVFGQRTDLANVSQKYTCNDTSVYDGLFNNSNAVNGFTNSVYDLQQSISKNVDGSHAPGYAAIQFALLNDTTEWRSSASRVLILISDHEPSTAVCSTGDLPYTNNVVSAGDAISSRNAYMGFVVASQQYPELLLPYATASLGIYDAAAPFRDTLESLASAITNKIVDTPVLERDTSGSSVTFLSKAKMSVTYDGDLSYLWTSERNNFRFSDVAPNNSSSLKGLVNFPFTLHNNAVAGIPSVHLMGNPENWVYFKYNGGFQKGEFGISYPHLGYLETRVSDPLLIAENATRPQICSNYQNDVFICCEAFTQGFPDIKIIGTGDFAQNSITGPKASRVTRFLTQSDFSYTHNITSLIHGVNQLCSLVSDKNNIIHVCWQSNRNGYWNIYYANGQNTFNNVRLTNSTAQSYSPSITVGDNGNIFVAYHNNRFKTYEIFLAYKEHDRIKPLLEQDAYLNGMRLNYRHYADVLPIFIYNTFDQDPYDPYISVDTSEHGYHVIISFYDNPNFEGEPKVQVDSRKNLDAFIAQSTNSTLDMTVDGINIQFGFSTFIYFSAISNVSDKISYPYPFEENKTYFPQVVLVKENGEVTYAIEQRTSFSCSQCKYSSELNSASIACSIDIVIENTGSTIRSNYQVNVYADASKSALHKTYTISNNSGDLANFQINNLSMASSGRLGTDGLLINANEKVFLQVYPSLSDIECGISYFYEITQITNVSSHILFDYISGNELNCSCNSTILSDEIKTIDQIDRWHSSAFGYADMRLTNTTEDCLKPSIQVRSNEACLVFFEKYNKQSNDSSINGVSFNVSSNQAELGGTGSEFWFDYDPAISGFSVRHEVDLFDRPLFVYEQTDKQQSQMSKTELPTSSIAFKNCDFIRYALSVPEQCDKSKITDNIIVTDKNIDSSVVKKILLGKKNLLYYTFNSRKEVIPVVRSNDIVLQIWGTPEVVAIRVKNETDTVFSDWCSFRPEISDYYIEKEWTLTKNSGIKQVCIQAMTYSGVTTSFCTDIVADYQYVTSTINLYSDNQYTKSLPINNGLFVASTSFDIANLSISSSQKVYVEIIPHQSVINDVLQFDVLMQGEKKYLNQLAAKTVNSLGQTCYRGEFTVYVDGINNSKDGAGKIVPRFDTIQQTGTVGVEKNFVRDQFNVFEEQNSPSAEEIETYRQEISGRIGIPVLIRPDEDPYFIFGDHDFFTEESQPRPTVQ